MYQKLGCWHVRFLLVMLPPISLLFLFISCSPHIFLCCSSVLSCLLLIRLIEKTSCSVTVEQAAHKDSATHLVLDSVWYHQY